MSQKVSPCKGCTDRNPGCHDRCEKYNSWKAEVHKLKAAEREYTMRRREDWMHSEEKEAGRVQFAQNKNRMKKGKIYGR